MKPCGFALCNDGKHGPKLVVDAYVAYRQVYGEAAELPPHPDRRRRINVSPPENMRLLICDDDEGGAAFKASWPAFAKETRLPEELNDKGLEIQPFWDKLVKDKPRFELFVGVTVKEPVLSRLVR